MSILGRNANDNIAKWGLRQSPIQKEIKTADGTTHQVQSIVKIPVTFNKVTHKIELLVVPEISRPLILGTNFWQAFNLTVALPNVDAIISDEIPASESPTRIYHQLNDVQSRQMKKTISHFRFSKPDELTCTKLIFHKIDTGTAKPIKQRPHQVSPYMQKAINEEIDRLLSLGIIERATSPTWLSPIHPVKKSNGRVRLCLDARKLNEHTVKNSYPQQNANRILQRIQGTQFLSTIDLSDAYYQIPIAPECRNHTAFSVSSKGTYRFIRMANGLCNASSTLCELVDTILGCDLEPFVFPYMDDFIVCTSTFEKHVEMLKEVATRLKQAGLTINAEKSYFCLRQLRFLGHIISDFGIFPDREKIRPIIEYPTPRNVKDIRRLNGMCGYYRPFLPHLSTVIAPITELLKKKYERFVWTNEANVAFENLKEILSSPPVLIPPDYSLPFTVHCDASDTGLGAVLMQTVNGAEKVIAYYSSKLSTTERNYTATERECLAVIRAIEKFLPYIGGIHFKVVSDHASLKWLQNVKDPTGKLARWAIRLQAHDFELIHRKGKDNVVPDALSRAAIDLIDYHPFTETKDENYIKLKTEISKATKPDDNYRIENDLIYQNVEKANEPQWKLLVPADKIQSVLEECHNDILSGHGGFWKTLLKVRENYTWPRMRLEIYECVKQCDICKSAKAANTNQTNLMGEFRNPESPFRQVAIDYIGPLPRSKNQFKWIFTIVDCFSKFVLLIPLREATANLTIKAIENELFLTYGVPEQIISDNGTQFKSKLFTDLMQKYQVKMHYTPNYHPQANPCEAANKTVGTMLRCYIQKNEHNNWDKILPSVKCAMNNSFHYSTLKTPYEILFGTSFKSNGKQHKTQITTDEEDRAAKLTVVRQEVQNALKHSYENSRKRYNLRARPIEYQIGDYVMKKNTVLSNKEQGITHKLLPRYDKCKILGRTGNNSYLLADERGKTIGNFPSQALKKY